MAVFFNNKKAGNDHSKEKKRLIELKLKKETNKREENGLLQNFLYIEKDNHDFSQFVFVFKDILLRDCEEDGIWFVYCRDRVDSSAELFK